MRNISHCSLLTPNLDLVLVVGLEFFAGFGCFIIGFVVTAIFGLRLVVAVGAVGVIFLMVFAHIDDHLSLNIIFMIGSNYTNERKKNLCCQRNFLRK